MGRTKKVGPWRENPVPEGGTDPKMLKLRSRGCSPNPVPREQTLGGLPYVPRKSFDRFMEGQGQREKDGGYSCERKFYPEVKK